MSHPSSVWKTAEELETMLCPVRMITAAIMNTSSGDRCQGTACAACLWGGFEIRDLTGEKQPAYRCGLVNLDPLEQLRVEVEGYS